MILYPKNAIPLPEVKKFILIFYFIGVLGFLIPWTRSLFSTITPLALLLSTYLIAAFHGSLTKKDLIVFASIFAMGYGVEALGVNTGLLFGHYSYGSALGVKVLNTPLLIGLNWLFLVYAATSIAATITKKKPFQLLLAPTLMLVYDLVLEQLAPFMDMWSWLDGIVPTQNYVAWWIFGFLFASLIHLFKVETKNPLVVVLFSAQFVFFGILFFVFNGIR